MSSEKKATGSIRPVTIADAAAVTAFLAELGLVMPEGPDAVSRHWRDLWVDNPALTEHRMDVSLGSVLEDAGRVKGFFGNIPQVSWLGERKVLVSSARAWAVAPEYRSETSRLCAAYFNQKDVDLLSISSANPPAGKRCLAFGGARMPQPGYADILYWVVDPAGFLSAAFRKKKLPGADLLGRIGGLPLRVLSGRRPTGSQENVEAVPISGVDDAFDGLWRKRRAQLPDTLLASRDAATLRWYFGLGAGRERTRFLRFDKNGELKGYAVVVREDAPLIGLRRLKIADLFVDGDDPGVASSLLAATYDHARAERCHVLELVGLAPVLRAEALQHQPYVRRMATFPFFYKALDPVLAARLASPDAWAVTAYDGDTALL